jgi:hypothetical protein
MGFSESVRNEMLDWFFGNEQSGYLPPIGLYVALIRTDDAEPSGGNYWRIYTDTIDWGVAENGTVENVMPITFGAPTLDWGTIDRARLYDDDASAGGEQLCEADITEPIAVTGGGATPEFIEGRFRISLVNNGLVDEVLNNMLDWWFSNALSGWTPPSNLYVALLRSDDSEVSGGNYARVTTEPADWKQASGGIVTNASTFEFSVPTSDWGVIDRAALYDDSSGGTQMCVITLNNAVTILASGTPPTFLEDDIEVKIE